jgi:hypothetical protein
VLISAFCFQLSAFALVISAFQLFSLSAFGLVISAFSFLLSAF